MATMMVARPPSHETLQRRLLHLDCSPDLQSYSRNLGPGVQEKTFQRTSDALRAQLEEHRDFLLRHQQHGHAELNPVSHFRSPVAPSPHVMPPGQHATPLPHAAGRPQHHVQPSQPQTRPQTQPPQAIIPQWPPAPKAPTPIPGNIETYPPALRDALERCSRQSAAVLDDGTLYHVTYQLESAYMSDKHEVVATCRSPWTASRKVAEYFVEDFLGYDDGYEAQYEVSSSGTLSCEIESYDSRRERVTVFVRQGQMHG